MPQPKISSAAMRAANLIGNMKKDLSMALAEVQIGEIQSKAIIEDENSRQRLYETGQDSLKTIQSLKQNQKLQQKIKKGFKLYQQKTGHELKYDKITVMDVINDPSLWNKIGDTVITDTVTGAEFNPGNFAGFADINDNQMFEDFAANMDNNSIDMNVREYGVEYKDSSYTSEHAINWALNAANNEIVARKKYKRRGIGEWAKLTEVKIMEKYAEDRGGTFNRDNMSLAYINDLGQTITLTNKEFRTGKGVEFDEIKDHLALIESENDPTRIVTNNERAKVEKDSLYYGTRDVGLYGINEKDLRPENWTYTDDDGFQKDITTNQFSSIDGKPDLLYKEVQSLIGFSAPNTEKDDIYQSGGIGRFIGAKLKNAFTNRKEDDEDDDGKIDSLNIYKRNN